ncbi:SDR family oxidoreductase [Microbacterium sp.]|uniref:SDR family NAD(P)-dependent oxidoreductase n=1 Tax=Microbacterium sp. TaxID=51671 RepID=UPI0026038820|nr:SDR family NAD(P)-dependent oxidoreductase [Microbacterium sp.]MCV0375913.1 SDR family NAD(P)-dependent oxidoreductase [Microbacterium sp.]MCV0390169.1 SDR family NAD(P)-dependent oxidoreductase [Microbacterium sp.]MCV0417904.1 SDR family NAD(P)-dependent oxidoreductase [Microbacterium sp.]MCV0422428.1 SDR family NAD(P)-dependent oxidoreductase [Microbacterium sp.]
MKHLELTGSTTVITGAANGMGADIARLLAARGVHLALVDHDAASLATIAAELQGVRVTTHVVDLRHDEAVFATAADITEAHPRINALITCAGSSMLGDIDQLTMEEMRWLTDVNLWGTVSITKALLPALRAAPAAHITHLASVYALAAPAGRIPYAVSKFAVRAFSEALRHELEGTSVSVGAVYPAGVRTGIILHGRYAAAIDPEVAARAAAAQAAMYHTEPTDAAARIVRATERRAARTMVGREARLIDVLTRIAPASYWRVMRRPLRAAIDTTTPAT